ncbi:MULTISPECIES: hypothetical protein [Sphingomonadaceae]|jgi:hypothetical protein|uniref:Uncharacterized protein n=2 Tax=Novosphingobium panipatense TaxID=428991 RepID=A0ABY1QU53_9SPHN|nr:MULTISPECIES: hypothetical protein [Sphingomonadaceae]SMP80898.1 hypothetical protein SAMN06296065_11581 [Novosphingobium panipatense]
MNSFFVPLGPGIYRSGTRVMETEDDGNAWTQAYDALIEKHDAVVVILDAAQRPGPEAGKPLALWLKARRETLAAKVKLAIYVVEDAAERKFMEERSNRASIAFPYPTAFVGSFADAEQLAARTLGVEGSSSR